jgi:hypothetical protein
MIVTKYNHLMDNEFIRLVQSQEKLTELEQEMLNRLLKFVSRESK